MGRRIENDGNPVERDRCQRLMGKLIYLSYNRPDIAFVVSMVSQHMHSPKEARLEVVYKILRYLKSFSGRRLFFKKNERREVEVYTSANQARSIKDRRSTIGYCTNVYGNLVTWSKKQNVMTRSNAKTEFELCGRNM